jgi:septal ring factor EnvC (AmiA/AmiB activator)
MWDKSKQRRLEELRLAESERRLGNGDRDELAALIAERCGEEELALQQTTRQTEANVARLEQQVQQVQDQNRELAALIQEQEAYLSQVQAVIAELEARRHRWRERYARVTGKPLEEPVTRETAR